MKKEKQDWCEEHQYSYPAEKGCLWCVKEGDEKKPERETWHEYFLSLCKFISRRSKDQNTQVGCVIVGPDNEIRSTGYNCFPRGVNDNLPDRQERPGKYFFFEHAERNAIYNAARVGISLKGCTLYVTWIPCAECARGIIQAGISSVIIETKEIPERWKPSCKAALIMLKEANIPVMIPVASKAGRRYDTMLYICSDDIVINGDKK